MSYSSITFPPNFVAFEPLAECEDYWFTLYGPLTRPDDTLIDLGCGDGHLVRRFAQLMGIYPPGTLVRLDDGTLAVVLRVHAPDPYKPTVRVIIASSGEPIETPLDVNLWEAGPHAQGPKAVSAPLDPADHGIDPLTYL